ncbi:MAG: peptidoglycan-binding domain-containing protein, partial [Cyanobacteriota bacterium]|nr:peptidoglycan-binding domain-containing protein [Cyanobacteriota bacterium]
AFDVARAVTRNRKWGEKLGWQKHYDEIVRLLHNQPYTPNEEEFAELVYQWQRRNNLTPDGIIGPNTWARMKAVLGIAQPSSNVPSSGSISYSIVPGREYGPRWRSLRPPGLPSTARKASRSGAALPYIEQVARQQNLGEIFVKTVKHLAKTESGATFARPADNNVRPFNVLPKAQRGGKAYISAWGVFQFNRDAWRSLPGVSNSAFPWESTPYEEIARPLRKYAKLFAEIRRAGGTAIEAARGIRLWHMQPNGLYKPYLRRGAQLGFSAAWQRVPAKYRARVDRHLRNAGIL